MMPPEFREYAELWQEQIEPEELARLQTMAKKIERNARRKRLLDVASALGFVGAASFLLWSHPASPRVEFGYLSLMAMCLWLTWRRHQITQASRAIAIDDPRVFFEKTIENVRAEINLSTTSICIGMPAAILCFFLGKAVLGLTTGELLRKLYDKVPLMIFIGMVLVLATIYFIRDNIKLRRQLRRLESLRREWDEQRARDPAEGR